MGVETKIAWTTHTFNPWIGCTKVHEGCTHCYAESFAKRYGKATWGDGGTRVLTSVKNWREPIKWNRAADCTCGAAGRGNVDCAFCEGGCVRPRVFCASLADVFEDWEGELSGDTRCWGTMDEAREALMLTIDQCDALDWLLLTKRPENIRRMWTTKAGSPCRDGWGNVSHDYLGDKCLRCDNDHRENVWLGTSVSNQATYDEFWPKLAECHGLAKHLFLSVEPLLGPVKIKTHKDQLPDWIIIGGESGHGARPCNIAWVRSLVKQCQQLGIACFVKQLGARIEISNDSFSDWPHEGDGLRYWPADYQPRYQGELVEVRTVDSKGGDMDEWPEDVRVQEFPES